MPNYDFKCKICNSVIELQDPAPPSCVQCGEVMNRIWTSTPVHFRAGGFYKTGG